MNVRWVSFFIGVLLIFILPAATAADQTQKIIKEAQKKLRRLKYYNYGADGIVGAETRKAIFQYQYETDLPITGKLDKTTLKHLNRPVILFNTQDFAPFHYQSMRKGEAYGPIAQIVKLVCTKAGINCRISLYDNWRLAQQDVRNGNADGLFVIAWNSQRAQWLHRSTAIVETEYGLFVRTEENLVLDEVLQQPAVFQGYRIGVYGPSGTSDSLDKLNAAIGSRGVRINIEMTSDDKQLFKKLAASKEKYAVYSNRIVGESITKGLGLNNIRYAGRHRGLSYYVGFSKQTVPSELVEKFNKAYLDRVKRGDVLAIMANHSMPIPKRFVKTTGADSAGKKEGTYDRFDFQDLNGSQVVTDTKTCLMWQRSGTPNFCSWQEAVAYVQKLNRENHGGFSDWRLPAMDELRTLIEKKRQDNQMYIHPVFDAVQQTCWSADKEGTDIKFADFSNGSLGSKDQGDTNFTRAVRNAPCK